MNNESAMSPNLRAVPAFLEETSIYINTPAKNPSIAPLFRLIKIIKTEAETIKRFMYLE